MKRSLAQHACITLIALGLWVSAGVTLGGEILVQFVNQEIIGDGGIDEVTFVSPDIEAALRAAGVTGIRTVFQQYESQKEVLGQVVQLPNMANYHVITLPDSSAAELIAAKANIAGISSMEENILSFVNCQLDGCTNPDDPAYLGDPGAPSQWYLQPNGEGVTAGINVVPAWDVVCNAGISETYRVGIFDGGVESLGADGDCIRYPDGNALSGHGAAVYSIVGANANNSFGIAGIGRYLDAGKSYSTYPLVTIDVFGEMIYDAVGVCDLITSSSALVDARYNATVHKLLQYAYLSGIPIIVAGGQNEDGIPLPLLPYPARYDLEVIGVSATSRATGDWAGWCHYGPEIDLAAPGEDLAALDNGGGWFRWPGEGFGGTSGAQPLVAGTVALMKALRPELLAEDYEGVLKAYAVDVDSSGYDWRTGWGRLNAGRAVLNLIGAYGVQAGSATGAATMVTEDYVGRVVGVSGLAEDADYYIRQYKHTIPVVWEHGYIDSVAAWGRHIGSSGYRKPQIGNANLRTIQNVPMSYRVYSNNNWGIFETYAYEIFGDPARSELLETIGDPVASTITIAYGVVGKRPEILYKPNVASRADFVVPAGHGGSPDAVLGVRAVAANGDQLAVVRVDLTSWGGSGWTELTAVGPEEWTVSLPVVPAVPGEYALPVFAQDETWHNFDGMVTVEVAEIGGEFTDKSSFTGDLTTLIGEPSAIISLDYDSDGKLDILMGFEGSVGSLMRADLIGGGVPSFSDQTPEAFPNPIPAGICGLVSADIDNDGDEDLLACHATNPQFFRCDQDTSGIRYIAASTTVFESNTEWNAAPGHIYAAAWSDYNRDGWIDLAVIGVIDGAAPAGYPGGAANLILYRNAGGVLMFSDAIAIAVGDQGFMPGETPVFLTWMDVDQDGRADLLVSDAQGGTPGTLLFTNEGYSSTTGDCAFLDRTQEWFGSGRGPDNVVAARVFDYDNDGLPDVALARTGTADNLLIYRNVGTYFEQASKSNWSAGTFVEDLQDIVIWDFDHNGAEDLVTVPAAAGAKPRLLLNGLTSAGNFGEVVQPGFVAGDYRRGVAADWSGDRPALFFAKSLASPSLAGFFYTFGDSLSQNNNAYTRLQIGNSGTLNGTAIGTQVTATFTLPGETTPTHVYRTVDGGSGNGGQQARTLDIGLGGFSGHQIPLVITWPDGTQQSMAPPVTSDFSPEMVVTINKTTAPLELLPHVIRRVSVNASATFNLGLEDDNWWVFQWDMNHQAHGRVHFESTDIPAGCSCMLPGATSIDLRVGDPNVDYDVLQIGDHLFRHKLTWRGRCCYQNCDFDFAAFGAFSGPEIGSGTYNAQTGAICTSGY